QFMTRRLARTEIACQKLRRVRRSRGVLLTRARRQGRNILGPTGICLPPPEFGAILEVTRLPRGIERAVKTDSSLKPVRVDTMTPVFPPFDWIDPRSLR